MRNKLNWLEAVLLIAPLVALLMVWNNLPARVPIHWNLRGEIDGWGSKASLLLIPLTNIGIIVLLHILPWFDPKLGRTAGGQGRMQSGLGIIRLALAGFFGVFFWMLIAAALGHPVAGRIVPSATLLLLAIIGNYSANLRPNYFVGIRTPWTLESPETWRATHRLGGRLMFFSSVLLLVLQFFISESTLIILIVALVIFLAAWALWYSWRHYHTQGTKLLESSSR
ncbi:MAG: SdpI family protein [Chthoniobacterales bacterium]